MKYPIKNTPYFVRADEKPIEQGGVGSIFECLIIDENDDIIQSNLVMKKITNEIAHIQYHRFEREMNYIQQINHKNILRPVYCDYDEDYIIMDKYPYNLKKYIEEYNPDFQESLDIYSQILDGVSFIITEGILHRDLKPENILVDNNGSIKITDFGISSKLIRSETRELTMRTAGFGTYYYSSPEQLTDLRRADERSEVFSLGRVMYVLFSKDLNNHEMPYLSKLDAKLRSIIKKATEYDPDKRYQTVNDLVSDFDLIIEPKQSLNIRDYQIETVIKLIEENIESYDAIENKLGFILGSNYEDTVDLTVMLDSEIHQKLWKKNPEFYGVFIENLCLDLESKGFPFSYVEKIISSVVSILKSLSDDLDIELQVSLIKASAHVSVYHNRWEAMRNIGRYISTVEDRFLITKLKKNDSRRFNSNLTTISTYHDSEVLQSIIN